MFGTIRRHQSWLLWVIVVATIVSFVWYFNPAERAARRGGRGAGGLGTIDGHVITPMEFKEARDEVRLRYFSNYRKFPENDDQAHQRGFDLDREATYRLVLLAKVKEDGIEIADSTLGEFARRVLGGDPSHITEFEVNVLKPAGITMADFERFLRNDLAIQQLSAIHGAAGRMVTQAEAEDVYRREHQEVAAQMAMFSVSNYLNRVAVTNDMLVQWYSNRMAGYRTPEKAVVSYVSFPKTNFFVEADKQLESISNLNARIQEEYYKAGTNAFKDTNGNVLPMEKALTKIREDARESRAMVIARKRANDFAGLLYDAVNSAKQPSAALLDQVAKTNNLNVQVTPQFDADEGLTNLNVGPNFTRAAFSLNLTNNPVLPQPIEGEDAYYVIALKENIPSRAQSFAEVKKKVEDDYRRSQAFGIMTAEARELQTRLTNGIMAGKSFDEIVSAARVPVLTLPPISRATESLTNLEELVNVRQLKNIVLSMDPGKVSPFLPNPPEGGFIIYVKQRLPLNESKMKEEMPKFIAEVRFSRQQELFNQWFRKVVEKAAPNLPLLSKPQTPQRTAS